MRSVNLTAAQLKRLMAQASTNSQAAKKLERGLYESEIETTIVAAMQQDGWRAFKMQYSFDQVKKLTLGEPGMADHLFLRPLPAYAIEVAQNLCWLTGATGQILWWEFKASKKRRRRAEYLSHDQVQWQQLARAQGFLIWSAGIDHEATIDGAAQHYLDSGLARRREPFVALIPPEGRGLPDRPRRLGDG